MEEPSLLDYLKAKLAPWRGQKIEIPLDEVPVEAEARASQGDFSSGEAPPVQGTVPEPSAPRPPSSPLAVSQGEFFKKGAIPWRSLLAFALALTAQLAMQPGPERSWKLGVILYLL